MMHRRVRSLLNYASGDGGLLLSQLLLFMWVLRVHSPESFGAFVIAQMTIMWLQTLTSLGMNVTAPYDLARFPTQQHALIGQMIRLRLLVAAGVMLGLLLVASWMQPLLKWSLVAASPLLMTNALQLDFACVGTNSSRLFRWFRWATVLLTTPLVGLICILADHPAWMFVGRCVGALPALWWQWRGIGLKSHHLLVKTAIPWRAMLRRSLSSTSGQFFVAGIQYIDVYLLGLLSTAGLEELGEYRVANRLIQVGTIPLLAGVYTWAAELAKAYADRRAAEAIRLERYYKWLMWALGLAGSLCIVVAAGPVLEWVAGRPLSLVDGVIPWMACVYMAMAWQNAYTSQLPFIGLTRAYLIVNAAGLAAAVLFCAILIPLWQCSGAAVAIACAYLVMGGVGRWLHAGYRAYESRS
jgi:O-antigen/teichoic acid export membrane protein